MPSIPLARNAIVGLPPAASNPATRGATRSARVDSARPHVRRTRDLIVARVPARAARSGSTARVTISCISWGTPGTA